MKTKKTLLGIFAIVIMLLSVQPKANAHCEIPCGIYGDSLRVALLYEHIETIEKSMKQIEALSKADNVDYNQVVRWVVNKEEHAKKLQEIVSQYFLHQRIKAKDKSDKMGYAKYTSQLAVLHKISVLAMKSKQSTNLELIGQLNGAVHDFEHLYFHKHEHHHHH